MNAYKKDIDGFLLEDGVLNVEKLKKAQKENEDNKLKK